MVPREHRRAAIELMLSAGAGRINRGLLVKDLVPTDLAQAMLTAGLLHTWAEDPSCWDLTPQAHRLINRIVADAQDMLD